MAWSALHNHSEFSVLDGFAHPQEYLDRAQEIGLKAFAITEHGNQYSWVYFDELKKNYPDIKIIYGVELYECFNTKVQDKDNKYFHLVALAKNERGRIALNEIITISNFEGFYYKPRVDLQTLSPYANDIVVLSACLASKIARESDYKKCIQYVQKYKSIFPHFYLEMQSHDTDDQREYNQKILKLSQDTNTDFVITTDSHAATKDDLYYQARHVQIAHDDETLTEVYSGCYLQSEDEIHEIMDTQIGSENVDFGLEKSNEIADSIDIVDMPFQEPQLPTFPLPDGYKDNFEYLKHLTGLGWITRGIDKMSDEEQSIRRKRLDYELGIIHQMNYDGYFLIVWDFINYAKNNDIIVGDGRGSGGGAIVNYLLGISELDPIKYDLIFERFLNPERVSMPDIDLDFADRDKIISYLMQKYGDDRVCQIINFSYITPVVAIKDVARVLGIPYFVSDKISKKFVYETFEECVANNPNLYEEYIDYKELFDIASKISGRVRNASIHAGGVGIVDTKITDYMAMKVGNKGEHVIQVDKKKVEEIGIIKFDILGVATLGVVQEVMHEVGLTPWDLNINNPKFANDEATFKLLQSARTNGVFQVESQGMKDLLLRLQPTSLEDVSAILALYRPDSMAMLEDYIYYKHHPDEITYWHPDMIPLLEKTYGCIIYQEEIMDIVRVMGGRTYGGADKFRKGIGKKDKTLVKQEADKLYSEILKNGYIEELAKRISEYMATMGGYSFNKCLSGDTKLKRPSLQRYQFAPTIEEMYKIKNDYEYALKTNHKALYKKYNANGYGNALSMYNDFRVRKNKIIDIRYEGRRQTYLITTENGSQIKCTDNHKFPTPNGNIKLSGLKPGMELYVLGEYEKCAKKYNLTDGHYIKNIPKKGEKGFQNKPNGNSVIFENYKKSCISRKCKCEICGREYSDDIRFELHHVDLDRTNNNENNFQWLCVSCHKKEHYKNDRIKAFEKGIPVNTCKIVSIEPYAIEDVYDIEMEHPNHNFIVDSGIVTSNSHSALYAILTMKTAYLKAHYPAHFFCALLNQNKGDYGVINKYIIDAKEFGVEILPPHINKSARGFTVNDGKILFGLEAIKGIGEKFVDEILEERSETKFLSYKDFVERVSPQKSQIISLVKAGAIPCKNKKRFLTNYAKELFEYKTYTDVTTLPKLSILQEQYGIDTSTIKDKEARLKLYNQRKAIEYQILQDNKFNAHMNDFSEKYLQNEEFWEFDALSIFISNNPFEQAYRFISQSFDDVPDNGEGVTVGIIANVTKKKDRKGKQFAFISLYSAFGLIEITCWHTQLKQYEDLIKRGNQVAIMFNKKDNKATVKLMKTYQQWLVDRKLR